jgi:uncharacterized protein YggT (Ycf19 family)
VVLLLHALNAAKLLVIADALFSWVFQPTQFPRSVTKPLLDPIYDPIRRALKPFTGPVDLSPLLALAVLFALQLWIERRRATAEYRRAARD